MTALQLLDSRSFRNKVDFFISVAARKRPKPTDDELAEALQPVLDAVAAQVKVRPGPAQPGTKDGPHFDLGSLGDLHDLPFDPFKQQSTEPNPSEVMLDQGRLLVDMLQGLPEKGLGERHKFSMPMDWNAGMAPIFFEAAVKDGGKWALAPDGEGVRLGADKNSWDVTAVRVR